MQTKKLRKFFQKENLRTFFLNIKLKITYKLKTFLSTIRQLWKDYQEYEIFSDYLNVHFDNNVMPIKGCDNPMLSTSSEDLSISIIGKKPVNKFKVLTDIRRYKFDNLIEIITIFTVNDHLTYDDFIYAVKELNKRSEEFASPIELTAEIDHKSYHF